MSLHVKKINRQFSVLKKARVIGLFSCTGETNIVEVPGPTQIVTSDCPVMSGFFHAIGAVVLAAWWIIYHPAK